MTVDSYVKESCFNLNLNYYLRVERRKRGRKEEGEEGGGREMDTSMYLSFFILVFP